MCARTLDPWLFNQTLGEMLLSQDFANGTKVPNQWHLKYRDYEDEADLTTGSL